jgi:hypothetical protein
MKNRVKVCLFIIEAMLLCSCAANDSIDKSSLTPYERLLVGKWQSEGQTGLRTILRYPNKTFVEDDSVVYDLKKPMAKCTSHGTWRVEGNVYIQRFADVSNSRFNSWLKGNWTYSILGKISDGNFEYMGKDTPVIIEKKIGEVAK